ncbi:RCC1 domain-containing protein [Cystobacter fuscus]|uniref:RCC1 domain-containing protein n=1 Tax=Cystobacter fuscus TaxID=43 RepID=UPI0037BE43CB
MKRNNKCGAGAVVLSAFMAVACGQPEDMGSVEAGPAEDVGGTVAPLMAGAVYDAELKVPRCTGVVSGCDTVSLVTGRGGVGPERNAPNTLGSSCADDSSGGYRSDESIERVKLYTVDGAPLAPGKQVTLEVEVWAWSGYTSDALDLYAAADASHPVWTHLTTLVPAGAGAQTLKFNYLLPSGGSTQAVRAAFRYGSSAGSCSLGAYNDRDDLAFAVHVPAPTAAQLSTRIAAGGAFSLQVRQDGTVWAYGSSESGQLGDGSGVAQKSPVQVAGLTQVKAVAAGWSNALALKQDGTVWSWGDNSYGQLGDGTTVNRSTPVQVIGLSDVVAIAIDSHSLALKRDGTVWAWGLGGYGELGDGRWQNSAIPVQVSALSGVTAISAGADHSMALKSDGTVWTWGHNAHGQLGDGSMSASGVPIQVTQVSGVTGLVAGVFYSMILKQDGTVWVWGVNGSGQLGDGSTTMRSTPVQIPGLTGVSHLEASLYGSSFALRSDGSWWAWGYNGTGLLGDGTRNSRTVPTRVTVLSGAVALQSGLDHTVAIKQDGSVWGWGGQGAELGNPDYPYGSLTAVQAPGTVSVQ